MKCIFSNVHLLSLVSKVHTLNLTLKFGIKIKLIPKCVLKYVAILSYKF